MTAIAAHRGRIEITLYTMIETLFPTLETYCQLERTGRQIVQRAIGNEARRFNSRASAQNVTVLNFCEGSRIRSPAKCIECCRGVRVRQRGIQSIGIDLVVFAVEQTFTSIRLRKTAFQSDPKSNLAPTVPM